MAVFEPSKPSTENGALRGPRFLVDAEEELWKVWWLWGIPVAWSASAMLIAAEEFRLSGMPAAGDALDIARLAIYWFWCRQVWRRSGALASPLWKIFSKAVISAGLVFTVLT